MTWSVRGVAAAGLVVGALTGCGVLSEWRFERSVAAMEQVARTLGPDDSGEREVGAFVFQDVYRSEGRVYFVVGDTSSVDPYGYVWSPHGVPRDDDHADSVASSFEHLQGHWYWWSDSY